MVGLLPPGAGLLVMWYTWMVYVALLAGVVITAWIYSDTNRKGGGLTTHLAIALICVILMLPSFVLAVFWDLMITNPDLIVPMGYVGVLGGVGVVLTGLAYAMGIGVPAPLPEPPLPSTVRVSPTVEPRPSVSGAIPQTERTRRIGEQVAPAAWLVLRSGGRKGQQLSLTRGNNSIGRSSRCDVVVEDGTVSGEHARIRFENGQFVIYDLASLNGTFVNGQRTQKQLLMDGDEIRLGQLTLVFKKV